MLTISLPIQVFMAISTMEVGVDTFSLTLNRQINKI
jgi:hypothetical protein